MDKVILLPRFSVFFFLIFIFTLFYFTILYWFCHTLTWIHHGCTWVPKPKPPSHLPSHIISLDHPHAPAPNILYPASNIDWRFVSCMIVYMFQCHKRWVICRDSFGSKIGHDSCLLSMVINQLCVQCFPSEIHVCRELRVWEHMMSLEDYHETLYIPINLSSLFTFFDVWASHHEISWS